MGIIEDVQSLKGESEWMWSNASILAIDLEVDRNSASSWLPGWLRIVEPARAKLLVADFPEPPPGVGPYHEAWLLLHVRLWRIKAVFCPWIVVDDDVALMLGREYFGFPKKMGKIFLSVEDGQVKASVERKGARLLDISGSLEGIDPAPPPMLAIHTFNVWGLVGFTIQKLLYFKPQEEILEAQTVSAGVTVRGSERDPLDELNFGEVIEARLYRANLCKSISRRLPLPVLPVSPNFMLKNWSLRYL